MDPDKPSRSLAINSLVWGVVSLLCGLFAGIPAIIIGHSALNLARKSPERFGGARIAIAGLVLGYAGILVMAAVLLLALSSAKAYSLSIKCTNNMKSIGIAFRLWSVDHHDEFPFNRSASRGGTQELCDRDADGFDKNAARHFQVLSNELGQPNFLICPADTAKKPALDFRSLAAANVSYQLRTGTNVSETNPSEVLFRCSVHREHVGLADGSVQHIDPRRLK